MIPIEFLRQFRFGGYAIFDFAVVFLFFYLFSPFLSKLFLKIRIDIPKRNWIFLALPIGILTHLIVGRMTPMTVDFIDPSSHYFLKLLIILLLVLGIRGSKIVRKSEPKE